MASHLHLDFETYSECDLKKHGLDVYARHLSTEALMLGWAVDQDPVQLWRIVEKKSDMPSALRQALFTPSVELWAFNARFERLIFEHVFGIAFPMHRWRCAMVLAYSMSFSGSLQQVLQQVGFPEEQWKSKEGSRLIHKFSKPAPKNHLRRRYTHETEPADWQKFCEYCIQDVVVERNLVTALQRYNSLSREDWDSYALDQHINDEGMPVDRKLCQNALEIYKQSKAEIKQELTDLTGLSNPLSPTQMKAYLSGIDLQLPNLQKATLRRAQESPTLPDKQRRILQLYSQGVSKASTKWQAFLDKQVNGWVKGAFQYHGASRTGRWAGRGVQLHNLARGPLHPVAPDAIRTGSKSLLELLYGDPLPVLGSSIRSAITAPSGAALVVCDLTSIESVVLGWISGCTSIDQIFRQGQDTYKIFASNYFGIPYDKVTKQQRTFAKPAVLGCGYQLGAPGLVVYARDMGVEMSQHEAKTAVNLFRGMYPEIPSLWDRLESAIRLSIHNPGMDTTLDKLQVRTEDGFLSVRLPSGRKIWYYTPNWQPVTIRKETIAPDGSLLEPAWIKDSFTYDGNDRYTHKWGTCAAHGGLLVENVVQAIARDILKHGLVNYTAEGGNIVGHVHDEIIACEPEKTAAQQLTVLQHCMTRQPSWAPDLWLGAEGYIAKSYRKD